MQSWDMQGDILAAVESPVTVWSNQHLTALPASRAPATDWNAVLEDDAIRKASQATGE
jgi:hypothetical protein